jgi:phosphoribosylanthranilate isomerase
MARVKVKICGITNWTDAKRAIAAGADLLGFNFYPGSPRYITPARARRIVRRLPKGVAAVGVFVNETEDRTIEIARAVGLDYVQLHGDESPASVARIARTLPVIKAIRVRKPFRGSQIAPFKRVGAILLDAFDRRARGGTGKTFDWALARSAKRYGRIFLAGGLTPENVGEAIRIARPYAVDVCSGVEASPRKKDPVRMKNLMLAVRAARKVAR